MYVVKSDKGEVTAWGDLENKRYKIEDTILAVINKTYVPMPKQG